MDENSSKYSISEVDSLVLKAYRGAGFSWGLAQEAGNAAAWMALYGLPALPIFSRLVQAVDRQPMAQLTPVIVENSVHTEGQNTQQWLSSSTGLCPVIAGTAFSELALDEIDFQAGFVIKDVLQPLVLAHFVVRASRHLSSNLLLSIADLEIHCFAEGIDCPAELRANCNHQRYDTGEVCIRVSNRVAPASPERYQRAVADAAALKVLENFAWRTYVPASVSSRHSGAGAGVLDND